MNAEGEQAKAVLDARMPLGETGQPSNVAGAATVREFLVDLLSEVWRNPPKRAWGGSDWQHDLKVALISAGLVSGAVNEPGFAATVDEEQFVTLVGEAIGKLDGAPEPINPPPLDYQVDVLCSMLAHLRMRLEFIERGADFERSSPNQQDTAAQAWGWLLLIPWNERLRWIESVRGAAADATSCFMRQHDRVIDEQRERIVALEMRVAELGGEV